ncbi:thioredoxin H1-like [Actinidia eriantha]|uniref:thioredoxin H1-like n=1 Tax=Actinidia eriantha TaxID=165200 RepID=UPI002587D381|nr:thioredoxin H1-like [Actinidia eriantha]
MASAETKVIGCHSVDQWNAELQKGNESKKLMVVDFTASWCGPCRFIAPILADIARRMTHITFLKVDVDELKSVAEDWAVEAMPTFVFIKEGKVVDRVVGAKKEKLVEAIEKHGGVADGTASA